MLSWLRESVSFAVMRKTEVFNIDHVYGDVESAPTDDSPILLQSSKPILHSDAFNAIVNPQRRRVIAALLVVSIFSPFIFRYALGNSSNDKWASNIDGVEWLVLVVVFMSCIGSIIKLLPVISGRPTDLEASQECILEGTASLGVCSPFVSEDEAILLRSFIGRACTVFQTIGGRHNMNGLYLDTILNEKRIKGEAQRKHLWHAWMRFLDGVVDVCQKSRVHRKSRNSLTNKSSPHDLHNPLTNGRISNLTSEIDVNDLHQPPHTLRISQTFAVDLPCESQVHRGRTSSLMGFTTFAKASQLATNVLDEEVDLFESIEALDDEGSNIDSNFVKPKIITIDSSLQESNPSKSGSVSPDKDTKYVKMEDIVPLVQMLNAWLMALKEKEHTFNYDNKMGAIESLFETVPFMDYFEGSDLLQVHSLLLHLYRAFISSVPDKADPNRPYHPDDVTEQEWILMREGLPDWTVCWSYVSRCRLRALPRDKSGDTSGPAPIYESTRIKAGTICFYDADGLTITGTTSEWLNLRRTMYKVIRMGKDNNGAAVAWIAKFPMTSEDVTIGPVPLHCLSLVEKNRGKTGALNFYNIYLRLKTDDWRRSVHYSPRVQLFVGILDARHTFVEPSIFWNDALPYFSITKSTNQPSRFFGRVHSEHPVCITVQYPQKFSNIIENDYVDNACATYYTMWQCLRDCGKAITSSGTNTIWEITNPAFEFCTATRSEDLGTSHGVIPHSIAVYLCINVALGIAKKNEDFIEALYRWSAGPFELLWPSLCSKQLYHHIVVAIPVFVFALACFAEPVGWYVLWIVTIVIIGGIAVYDKAEGRKALRSLVVSSVIVTNLYNSISSLSSILWVVIFPCRIGFLGKLAFGDPPLKAVVWGLVALFYTIPMAVFHDAMIKICRHVAPSTRNYNYDHSLWRGAQLYSVAFLYSLMSIIAGTYSAMRAYLYDSDLSMWSSFRVSDAALDALSACNSTGEFCVNLSNYILLFLKSVYGGMMSPSVMTKYYSATVLLLQAICLLVSTMFVNADKPLNLIVLIFVSALNIAMTNEIAVALSPCLRRFVGYPVRTEYIFGAIGAAMVIMGLSNGFLNPMSFFKSDMAELARLAVLGRSLMVFWETTQTRKTYCV